MDYRPPIQPLVQPTKHLPGCQTSDASATLGDKRASAAAEPREGWGRQAGARAGTQGRAPGWGPWEPPRRTTMAFMRLQMAAPKSCSDVTYSERPSLTTPSGLIPPHSLHIPYTPPTPSPQHSPFPASVTICLPHENTNPTRAGTAHHRIPSTVPVTHVVEDRGHLRSRQRDGGGRL